jgi:hypothetical protein
MAFTTSMLFQTVQGDKRVQAIRVTADGATGTVPTSLNVVEACVVGPVSAPTNPVIAINQGTTGTSILGTVGMTSCTSGNVYQLIVYGH